MKNSLGCPATGLKPRNSPWSSFRLNHPHNHPGDDEIEKRAQFLKELKKAVQLSNSPLKGIYEFVISL